MAHVDKQDWLRVMHGPAWCDVPSERRLGRVVPSRIERGDDGKRRRVTLGRFIVGAMPRQRVRYKDGDPCNCRRKNLVLVIGSVRYNEKARRRPYEVWVYIRKKRYFGGNWPTWSWADDIYHRIAAFADEAEELELNPQQIRQKIDKIIGRVRHKK